jgi:hypothetical protein
MVRHLRRKHGFLEEEADDRSPAAVPEQLGLWP